MKVSVKRLVTSLAFVKERKSSFTPFPLQTRNWFYLILEWSTVPMLPLTVIEVLEGTILGQLLDPWRSPFRERRQRTSKLHRWTVGFSLE